MMDTGHFRNLAMVNYIAMNIGVQTRLTDFNYIQSSGIAKSYSNSILFFEEPPVFQ